MKKANSKSGKSKGGTKKRVTISNSTTEILNDSKKEYIDPDDEEAGFGHWLKTGEGVQWMRLFVIGNSIAVFLTMTWPHLKRTLQILKEFIYGEEDYY